MKYLIIFYFITITSKCIAIENSQLIKISDLDYLFKNSLNKWNESVIFFDKKKSMSKVANKSNVYFLKSTFADGSITIKPYYVNNLVNKIILDYDIKVNNEATFNIILNHYSDLQNNFCTNISRNNNKINIKINKCN